MIKLILGYILLFSTFISANEISWNDFFYLNKEEPLELQEKIIFPSRLIPPQTRATLESFEYLFHGVYMAILQFSDCDYETQTTELELFSSKLYKYEYGAALEMECRLRIYISRDELDRPSLFHPIL